MRGQMGDEAIVMWGLQQLGPNKGLRLPRMWIAIVQSTHALKPELGSNQSSLGAGGRARTVHTPSHTFMSPFVHSLAPARPLLQPTQ